MTYAQDRIDLATSLNFLGWCDSLVALEFRETSEWLEALEEGRDFGVEIFFDSRVFL